MRPIIAPRLGRGVYRAALLSLVALLLSTGCARESAGPDRRGPGALPNHPLPFRAQGDYLAYWDGSAYQPFFMKGVNLGVGVPGSQPGQLAVTRDQYYRWLERMGEMGLNTLRVYTLHFPRFYEEFAAYNERHPEHPIFLVQGIWLDEEMPPSRDFFDMTDDYDFEIDKVIDAVHGGAEVEFEYGKAFGTYTVDVSPWVLAWVVGREVHADEIEMTQARHPEHTSYPGDAVAITGAQPIETWLTERIDRVITRDRDVWGTQRPVAFSTWPTLDPLDHPIEGYGSDEDRINLDFSQLDLSNAPGGFFIIFHAYPYYPDFVVETPEYADFWDDLGRNSYLGYLNELKGHYVDTPVVIGEFGTPSSWGNAHYGQAGMHHGGLDEAEVGHFAARMLGNIFDAGCAGGIYFSWMDEWWKRTWITDELDFPRYRRPSWHNVTAAEQNFGLIAFSPGEPTFDTYPPAVGSGVLERVDVHVDVEFFHVLLSLARPLETTDEVVIGFDTYRRDLGESVLPNGAVTELRAEMALTLFGDGEAQLFVTQAYDTYGIWHGTSTDDQLFHSIPTDGADWVLMRWKNNLRHASQDGAHVFPETYITIGDLVMREAGEPPSNLDGVVLDDRLIHVRIPWSLLQFTDPSQLRVLDDDRFTPGRETAESDGVALTVCFNDEAIETGAYTWEAWDQPPPTVEREKPSLKLYSQGVQALPGDVPADRHDELERLGY